VGRTGPFGREVVKGIPHRLVGFSVRGRKERKDGCEGKKKKTWGGGQRHT